MSSSGSSASALVVFLACVNTYHAESEFSKRTKTRTIAQSRKLREIDRRCGRSQ